MFRTLEPLLCIGALWATSNLVANTTPELSAWLLNSVLIRSQEAGAHPWRRFHLALNPDVQEHLQIPMVNSGCHGMMPTNPCGLSHLLLWPEEESNQWTQKDGIVGAATLPAV